MSSQPRWVPGTAPGEDAAEGLLLLGLSHQGAPLPVRERFAIERDGVARVLDRLRAGGAREALVLGTCNRVELYAVIEGATPARALDDALLSATPGADDEARALLDRHSYRGARRDVLAHLFRVAAGLDSLVLGEDQILAQVKASYDLAAEAGALGPLLHAAFQAAIHAGKRVRRETAIGENKLSISSVAVDLVKRVFADLGSKTVLLVGAGEAARLTLVHLRENGVRSIRIANRSLENAERLARELGGAAVPFDSIEAELPRVDVVITSVGAGRPLVTQAMAARALRARRDGSIFFVDIAVPRDVEPSVEKLAGAFLYNIDDLQAAVKESYERRKDVVTAASQIVEDEIERFLGRERHRALGPMIGRVLENADRAAREEAETVLSRFPEIQGSAREAVASLASRLVRRVLHEPLTAIRTEARGGDADVQTLARIVERMGGGGAPREGPRE